MSLNLFVVLAALMTANQILGTSYGSFREGFSKEKLYRGIWKIITVLAGYGAIALAAHYASGQIAEVEYISGILLDPISQYFVKVVQTLKEVVACKTCSKPS